MKVWIVARVIKGEAWQLMGVFLTKRKAIAACEYSQDAIWPMVLNKKAANAAMIHPDAYYPLCGVHS